MKAKCMGCNKDILWIKTISGKQMPCDPELITATGAEDKLILVTPEGYTKFRPKAGITGYQSHWSSCPNAGLFKGKK